MKCKEHRVQRRMFGGEKKQTTREAEEQHG
jgi:hypothetical protein